MEVYVEIKACKYEVCVNERLSVSLERTETQRQPFKIKVWFNFKKL